MLQFNTSTLSITSASSEVVDRSPPLWQCGRTRMGTPAEATPDYGFVFIRNGAERLLIMFNPRDPNCTAAQTFTRFDLRDTYRQKLL